LIISTFRWQNTGSQDICQSSYWAFITLTGQKIALNRTKKTPTITIRSDKADQPYFWPEIFSTKKKIIPTTKRMLKYLRYLSLRMNPENGNFAPRIQQSKLL